ncbi:MAG: hypothetical protein ABR600_14015 [Actinomycetota bacterium]
MTRTRLSLILVPALLATSLAFVPLAVAQAACDPPAPAPLSFKPPVFVDTERDGGEPVSVVAHDGSIIVGAHYGTTLFNTRTAPNPNWVRDYRNQTLVWRSTDDGATFKRIEFIPGAHTANTSGFSDPDFAIDSAGNLYGTEINLVNVSVFSSHDNGQTWPDGDPVADSGDRPWLAARGNGEVYLRITGNLQKSTDGGATWTALTDPPGYGKIFIDPTDPKGLYQATNNGVAVSRDDGNSWQTYAIPGASNSPSVMETVGVDNDGWVYYGYLQGKDIKFASFDPATTEWSTPVTIRTVPSTYQTMWAWTVAGDAGRAAVGWYELVPVAGTSNFDIHVHVAVTQNGRGSTFGCADGTTVQVPPQFSEADAMGRAIYTGPKPCSGTGCNATGDRRLGDFFTINFDKDGKVFVTTGDTTTTSGAPGVPDQISHPLFAIATDDSPKLVAGPRPQVTPTLVRDSEAGRDLHAAPAAIACAGSSVANDCEQPDTAIEPSVAVNPANPLNAVAAYQEGRRGSAGSGANGWATTFDGGQTWTYGELPGLTAETGGYYERASDAVVAFGPNNTVYASSLVFDQVVANGLRGGMAINTSHDGGATWDKAVVFDDFMVNGPVEDKNWVVVDNSNAPGHHLGRVYVVWDRVAPMLMNYSDDQGKTWLPHPMVVFPGPGIGAIPTVMPNGDLNVVFNTDVWIPAMRPQPDVNEDLTTRIVSVRAPGAGSVPTGSPIVFSPPTAAASNASAGVDGQRAGTLPAAAIDPVIGRLYVAWEDGRYRSDGHNDILVTASDDDGVTWGPIVRVNPGPEGDGVDHYNAMVDVGRDGIVRVGYRQRENGEPIDTMIQVSDDHGLHFSDPLRVNVVRSDPSWGASSRGGLFEGDYNQLAAAGDLTYIVRCQAYAPSAADRISNRYHQTAWVAVVRTSAS